MNGLISRRRRRLHNPEIDVTTTYDGATVAETAVDPRSSRSLGEVVCQLLEWLNDYRVDSHPTRPSETSEWGGTATMDEEGGGGGGGRGNCL